MPDQPVQLVYVEDHDLSREVMTMIAQNALPPNELTIFSDSKEFMTRMRGLAHKPDVVLLDVHVQPHDGFEMLTMLRKDPAYQKTRIIALTASVMNDEIDKLRSSGFDGAIGKPVSVRTFPGLLKQVLDGDSIWYVGAVHD